MVIASACVFNNHLDRGIDRLMARTRDRALVTGAVSSRAALVYGTVLGLVGFELLAAYTNVPTLITGLVGWITYVAAYGYAKRKSRFGTIVGSIPGATPPLAGYLAVTGHIDAAAIILFLTLAFWQLPHFYAIAMYRRDDYAAAGIPVWSVAKGMASTKRQILISTVLFIVTALGLTAFGYTGYVYMAIVLLIGGRWLWLGLKGLSVPDDVKWARTMFRFSLVALLAWSTTIGLAAILP